jgi:hypothetical protein
MDKKAKTIVLILSSIILFIAVIFIYVISIEDNIVTKTLDDVLYDNKKSYASCEDLPTVEEARQVLIDHDDVIKKITSIDSVAVNVSDLNTDCPDKAIIEFTYGGHDQRLQIEKIINSDNFFGLPYDLINY